MLPAKVIKSKGRIWSKSYARQCGEKGACRLFVIVDLGREQISLHTSVPE